MRHLAVPAFAALALMATAVVPLAAQEAVTINGVEAQRVIIAPPQNDLAKSIKAGLAARYAAAAADSAEYLEAQKLYYFYGGRGFEPLWLTTNGTGEVGFSKSALEIISVFENAAFEGLRPADYLTDEIALDGDLSDPLRAAQLETAFSAAAVRYAQHAVGGRVNPRSVSASIDLQPRRINGAEFLLELAASDAPSDLLLGLSPRSNEFQALRAVLAKHLTGDVEDVVVIPEGQLVRPGMSDDRLPLIRERLNLAAAEVPDLYDETLEAAIRAFQEEKGLLVDGVIGPASISALNGGNAATTEDIIANMERWRWMPEDLGDFHVFVNVPEFRLYVRNQEDIAYTTRVIVGQTQHQTPIFSDEIEHVVVNPFWNVPVSIMNAEIAPHLPGNPGYLAARNMQLLHGGQVVNAASVDWSTTSINNFRIRQLPGNSNALGHVKFLFPNRHAVYLHDTPSRSLFSRGYRTFSHGCVRVQNPMEFAEALLANEPVLTRAGLESQYGPRERWNNLETHVPVHIAYFTVRIDPNGNMQTFPDPYGHNERLKQILAN